MTKHLLVLYCATLLGCGHTPPKPEPAPSLVPAFWAACERSGYKPASAEHAACVMRLIDQTYPQSHDRRYTCTALGGGAVTCTER